MKEQSTGARGRYFEELSICLKREGLTVQPPREELLPIELEGRPLCMATGSGGVRYRRDDVYNDDRQAVLDKVVGIAQATAEYMRLMEQAPDLKADSLGTGYSALWDVRSSVKSGSVV